MSSAISRIGWIAVAVGVGFILLSPFIKKLMHLDTLSERAPAAVDAYVALARRTTERALEVLMAPDAWPKLMSRAIEAATARSRELAG